MAYPTSELYKNNIYNPYTEHTLRITVNDDFIVDNKYISSLDIDDSSFEGDTFTLGSAITCGIKLSLDVEAFEGFSLDDIKKIEIEYGIFTDDDTIEYIPIGKFDVIKYDLKNEFIVSLKLEDYMNRFDKEFDASNIVPCTRKELVQSMCNFFGVELGSTNFINDDVIVAVYDNTIKAKVWLSFISERAGGFAKFRYDGKLYIRSYGDTDTCVIDESKIGNETLGEQFTVSKVLYENGIQQFYKGDDTGTTIQLSDENPLSCTQDEIDNIYQSLNGLKFQSVDVQIFVDPSFETGDRLNYGNVYSFIQKKWSYAGGFDGGYKTILKSSEKMPAMKKLSDSQKIKKVQSELDEVNGKIRMISSEVDESTEKVADMEITVEGISSQVSSTKEQVDSSIEQITNTVENIQTSTQQQINVIQDTLENGVPKVSTTSGTFDMEGLHISKSDEAMSLLADWDGFVVKRDQTEVLTVRSSGVNAENITVRNYLTVAPIRMEKTTAMSDPSAVGLGFFYNGGA